MRIQSHQACFRLRPRSRIVSLGAAVLACALALSGCEEEPRHTGARPGAKPLGASGPIIGQRTQDIRNAATELQKGKATVGSTKITAKDPITLSGNVYVATIGRVSQLLIEDAMNKYRALNDRYPKDFDEFMNEIIKANGISLPKLPPYQKYGYDEKDHKLIILEYQDLKEQPGP